MLWFRGWPACSAIQRDSFDVRQHSFRYCKGRNIPRRIPRNDGSHEIERGRVPQLADCIRICRSSAFVSIDDVIRRNADYSPFEA